MGDILFLGHRVPYPPDRGDKIRAFHILKHLAQRRRVHLLAFADDPRDRHAGDALAPYTASRSVVWRGKSQAQAVAEALLTRRPASLTAFASGDMHAAVNDVFDRQEIDTIYVFSSQMAQYLPVAAGQRVIMDFVDVDSAKFAAYAETSSGPRRWMYAREARMLLAHDRAVAERADASLFVSAAEAAVFAARTGAARIHAVENGIDTALFDPAAAFARIDTAGPLIVFTGQMDYRPNIEGVAWFVDAILPNIRRRHPDARFAIVGRAPAPEVLALAAAAGVSVTGEIADVRGWLAAAAVVVAPLKLARGIQNKVLEAMAMARPVVASAAAAEGIDHDGTILVGGSAEAIASHVGDLIAEPAAAAALGASARTRVQARYSWDAALAPLDALIGLPPRSVPRRAA